MMPAMITITVTPGKHPKGSHSDRSPNDHAICDWNGQRFVARAFSATTAMARKLVDAGCPDQPWESFVVLPEGTKRSLFGPSLHAWAKRTVVEDDGGIRFEEYHPFPATTLRR